MFEVSELFEKNFNCPTKIAINQGGTWSGKTYTILQVLITYALSETCIITIVGQDIPNLKSGALRDFQDIIFKNPLLDNKILEYNKSDRIYTLVNGSIIEFKSYDDWQDAKSGKRDYLFLNEANGINYEIAKQLILRTDKKVFIDYNPDSEFWVHSTYLNSKKASFFYSDHRMNPFVSKETREDIENLRNIDLELWKIYARGITGRIEGLIYRHWKIIDEFPEIDYVYGLDFGYNHPTALIKCGWDDDNYFIKEEIYESGLTTPQLIDKMKQLDIGQTEIFADSARPDTIEELYQAGFNVKSSDKSVKDGINCVKSKPLNVFNSPNIVKELKMYKWKTDKNNKPVDEPVKFNDDGMDAMRYGLYNGTKLLGRKASWF
jgi:phage terminase large subunit